MSITHLCPTLLNALRSRYKSNIDCTYATLQVYLANPLSIGEHPQLLEEIDKLIDTEVSKECKSDKAYEEINFKDYGFNSYNDMMTGYKKAQEYYKLKGKELSIDKYLQVQAIKDMDLPF